MTDHERWVRDRADDICLELQKRYGKNWERLVGPEIAKALKRERVLMVLLTQANEEKYGAAQSLVIDLIAELEVEMEKPPLGR